MEDQRKAKPSRSDEYATSTEVVPEETPYNVNKQKILDKQEECNKNVVSSKAGLRIHAYENISRNKKVSSFINSRKNFFERGHSVNSKSSKLSENKFIKEDLLKKTGTTILPIEAEENITVEQKVEEIIRKFNNKESQEEEEDQRDEQVQEEDQDQRDEQVQEEDQRDEQVQEEDQDQRDEQDQEEDQDQRDEQDQEEDQDQRDEQEVTLVVENSLPPVMEGEILVGEIQADEDDKKESIRFIDDLEDGRMKVVINRVEEEINIAELIPKKQEVLLNEIGGPLEEQEEVEIGFVDRLFSFLTCGCY